MISCMYNEREEKNTLENVVKQDITSEPTQNTTFWKDLAKKKNDIDAQACPKRM